MRNKTLLYKKFVEMHQLQYIRAAKVHACEILKEEIIHSRTTPQDENIQIHLAQQLISYRFNSKMVLSIVGSKIKSKKLIVALPRKLHGIFADNFFIAFRFSTYLNFIHDFALVLRATILLITTICTIGQKSIVDLIQEKKEAGYTVIMLNPKFPSGNIFGPTSNYNFINWYTRGKGRKFVFLHFDNNYKDDATTQYNSEIEVIYIKKFKFYPMQYFKLYKNFIYAVLGNNNKLTNVFQKLKLVDQIYLAEQINLVEPNHLPNAIIFTDNHGVLKPYWVNALQQKKVAVHFFFLSSYDSPIFKLGEDPRQDFWSLNSWPNIGCVDEFQYKFIKKNILNSEQLIRITGFPDFSDFIDENLEELFREKFAISVFDYLPGVNSYGISTLCDMGYYTWEANLKFLSEIYEICEKNGFLLLHKSKRPYAQKRIPLFYKKSIKNFNPLYYRSIDTRVAVKRVLLASKVSISKPITSPAIVAKEMGLNSMYFDPLGRVQKSDPALRGIPMFSDTNEMEKYLQIIINHSNT